MPHVEPEALESLIWEIDRRELDTSSDEGAAAALGSACSRISTLRYDANLNLWFLGALWVAVATGATVASYYGNFITIDVWYDWPFVWAADFGLVGIALTVVYGVTFFLHEAWWQRFGGGRRDAEFYGDPLSRRPGVLPRWARPEAHASTHKSGDA